MLWGVKFTVPFSIALAILVLCSSGLRAETRRALLVGINIYQPDGATPGPAVGEKGEEKAISVANKSAGRGSWSNLDAAINDLEEMTELLMARYGFQRANIRVLKNSEATRNKILAELQEHLIDAAAPGDVSVFFYAGHGSQVKNSKSTEEDKMDETIVPSDSYRNVCDIRDKELARLFHKALDKGIVLTGIFDSCHSGSIARGVTGKARYLPPNPACEVADSPPAGPTPEQRGALILSSAQDYQKAVERADERGVPHGVFSSALLKTLRAVPVDEPAEQILLRVKALMQSEGNAQEPVLAGIQPDRPLFGTGSKALSGRTTVAVLRVGESGELELQGGRAVGLNENCELKKADASGAAVRIRVTAVEGLARCKAKVIQGDGKKIQPGDLFVLDRWVAPNEASLRVWIPPKLAYNELRRVAQELSTLRASGRVQWIEDPTKDRPTHVISWDGSGWRLTTTEGSLENLGKTPTAKSVLDKLVSTGQPKLFVHLPPPVELANDLKLGAGTANTLVDVSPSPERAQYLLAGRLREKKIQYAWVLPNTTEDDAGGKKVKSANRKKTISTATQQPQSFPIPLRTDWVTVGDGGDPSAAKKLEDYALRIGKIKAWLQIDAPPDEGRFPYRLALKNTKTRKVKTGGAVFDKESYGLVLRADKEKLTSFAPRWVYVFVLDSYGNSTLLFPPRGQGNVENHVAPKGAGDSPTEIQLGGEKIFDIGPPFGIDTYILLTSAEAIPDPDVLTFDGVRARAPISRGNETPLQRLLAGIGSAQRGASPAVPTNWSIERLSVKSEPQSNQTSENKK